MNVLVACEESQEVCKAFRARGHEAYSCDIQEPSGGHPEWHILGDALEILAPRKITDVAPQDVCSGIEFCTMDKQYHFVPKWDLLIAHPPCTYLSNVSTRSFSLNCAVPEKVMERWRSRAFAAVFFMRFMLADIEKICVENPAGFMNTAYRKPNQIIHPWMFAESEADTEQYVTKRTCLWLKGLPSLVGTCLQKPKNAEMFGRNPNGKVKCWEEMQGKNRAKVRSKTFPGIAKAMAEQWG